MSTDLTLPKNFGKVPAAFANSEAAAVNDELGQGVAASYAVTGYRGKVWSLKYQGNEEPLMREDGDGPRNSIEVVLVKASPAVSKIFYQGGYVDGSTAAPDCWSGNGQTPDASVQNKQHPTCADCPMNAWGSRVTEAGKQGKACADSRRLAILPIADLANEAYGGPMLLRVPAASLKDLKAYGDFLNGYNYPYYAVATRIAFDAKEAYPKFVFSAIRALTDEEAAYIAEVREDRRVKVVLAERADGAPVATGVAPAVASSPFEQDNGEGEAPAQPLSKQAAATGPRPAGKPAAPAATKPAATKPAATKPAATKPAAPPVTPQVADEIEGEIMGDAPEDMEDMQEGDEPDLSTLDFDAQLDALLKD
jgi:hypothetical protein